MRQVESRKLRNRKYCQCLPFAGTLGSVTIMTTNNEPGSTGKVKVAVLGAGSLGKEHVRIYGELAAAGLVDFLGLYDIATETAHKLAEKHRVRAFDSVVEAFQASDALSIVTPTITHFELAQ